MTTRANNVPVWVANCACGRGRLHIFQARGKRAYLYSHCPMCGCNQKPHDALDQQRLWNLIPEQIQVTITKPLLLTTAVPCPCCGQVAA